MSFQAYMDNVQSKTGKTPDDFLALGSGKGFVENGRLRDGVKAGQVIDWLKADFGLGHGHAMAMFAFFKGKRD